MCTAWPPIASTGRMSLRTELPTMQNRSRRHVEPLQQLGVDLGVLLEDDLEVGEVVLDPRRGDLAGLVHEIALRDQHHPAHRGHLGEHLGDVGEQLHGLGEHRRPISPSSPTTADGIVSLVTVIAARIIDSVNAFTP